MINLGFNSGKGMPNVYVELTIVDRILEGVAVMLATAAWVLALVFYFEHPTLSAKLFISPVLITVLLGVFLWASRAPIRFYNFPVKLTEQNYVMQYFIASRFVRILTPVLCLLIFFCLFVEVEYLLPVAPGLFLLFVHGITMLLLFSFIGYYVIAFRHR